jgi:regulator of replication initiation timing
VSEAKDIPLEDSLRDMNCRISLLLQDIDLLKRSNALLVEENADLKEQIETLTAVDRNFTSNENVTATATNIPFHSEHEVNMTSSVAYPAISHLPCAKSLSQSGEIMASSAKLGQIMMHRGSMRESAGSPLSVAVAEYMRLRSSEVTYIV